MGAPRTPALRSWSAGSVVSGPVFAVVGLLVALAVVAWSVSSSYFFSDDFLNFARAHELDFRSWVNGELFGHWLPGRKALDWGIDSRPLSFALAVTVLLQFVGVTALLTRLAVLRITRSGFWANIALVLLPVSAAVPATVQWWAGAAQVIPATTCAMLVVVLVLESPGTAGWTRAGALAGVAVALGAGLVFDERTAVIAVVAPLLLPLVEKRRAVWVDALWCYGVMALVIAVWFWVQSRHTTSDGHVSPVGTIVVFLAKALVQNAAPALAGWVTRPAFDEDLLWAVGAVVLLLLFAGVAWAGRRGAAAWLVVVWLAAVVGVALPAAVVRAEQFGVSAALEPRYLTMAMPLGVIALVGVLSLQRRPARRVRPFVGAVVGLAVVVGLVNLVHLHARTIGRETGAWAAEARASAAAQGVTVFYNSPVPGFVVPDAFYPYNLAAAVLPQVLPEASTVVTAATAGLVLADGTVTVVTPTPLGSAELIGATGFITTEGADGGLCYRALDGGGRLSFRLPDRGDDDGVLVLDVRGSFEDEGLRVATGPSFDELRDKTSSVGGAPPVAGATHWVTTEEFADAVVLALDADAGQALCVTDVAVGVLPPTL